MATKKSKAVWPQVVQGSHLTVTTYEDGRTELTWDDDALLQEVRDAIRSAETVEFVGSLALGEKTKSKVTATKKAPAKKAPAKKAPAKKATK